MRRIVAVAFVAVALSGTRVHAQDEIDWQRVTGHDRLQDRLARIEGDMRASFDAILTESATTAQERPFDIVARIEHCELIDQFSIQYSYLEWIEEVYQLSEECDTRLQEEFPEHPEVVLRRLEYMFGEELLAEGRRLAELLPQKAWTKGQAARLFTLLAQSASQLGDPGAGAWAYDALDNDSASDVRLILGTYYKDNGDTRAAIEVLTSPMDSHFAQDAWYLSQKMALLGELGESDWIVENYPRLGEGDYYYDHIQVAWALVQAGAIDYARQELDLAEGEYVDLDYETGFGRDRFEFEYKYGSPADAFAAYTAWRDEGWLSDPVGINRLALFFLDSSLPWRARDLLAVVAAIASVAAILLACLIPISLVHYRGLALRMHAKQPQQRSQWRLRHAWLAMAAVGLSAFCGLYFAGPFDINAQDASLWTVDDQYLRVARIMLAECLLTVLFVLPCVYVAARIARKWWGEKWRMWVSVLLAVGIGVGFRLPLLLAWLAAPDMTSTVVADNELWLALSAVRDHFGFLSALWIVAIFAPLVEEFVFRGVVLSAMSNHVGFGWANALQALLFAGLHQSLVALPFLFVFGAVAGWMTRRTGGLAAPIAAHATFNLIAALILLD